MNNHSISTRMIFRIFGLALLALIIAVPADAQKRWDELKFSELDEYEIPEIETFKADNGAKFFLAEDKELPLITLYVLVRSGEILSPDEKVGLASITGTVMRSGGTTNISSDSLNVLLENKAASLETGIGFSRGTIQLSVLKEDFEEMLPVLIDLVQNPAFPQEKIDLATKQQRTAISRRNDDPSQIISREFEQLIYGENSVYGRVTEYETLSNITREDVVEFHQKAFQAPNFYVAVTGDFESKDMKKQLREAFAALEGGSETNIIFPEVNPEENSTINLIHKSDVNQSSIQLGHLGTTRNEDYAALQVMNEILSGGFSGRLMQRIRTDLGLAYGVYGSYNQYINYPGLFSSGVKTKVESTGQTIEAVIEEIEKIQSVKITGKELEETKDRFLNSLVFEYDSDEKVLFERVSNEYNGLPEDTFEEYVENIKDVTVDDVQRVAKQYLHPDRFQILVVSNKDMLGDQLDQFGDVNMIDITIPTPGSSESSAPKASGDAELGTQHLNQMAEAVLGDNTDPEGLKIVNKATQYNERLPGGKITAETTINFTFPNRLQQSISTPMGNQEIEIDGSTGKLSMSGQSMDLNAAQVKAIMGEVKNSYTWLAANTAEVSAEYMGTKELDGTEYLHLSISGDRDVDLYLSKDTHLPYQIRYSQFNAQAGGESEIVAEFADWKTANGVTFAEKESVKVDGNVLKETKVISVEIK